MPLNSDYCCGWSMMTAIRDKDNTIIDFQYLYVNAAWCRLTGNDNPAGKKLSEVFPGAEPDWYDMYVRVVKSGKAEQLTDIHESTGEGWDAFAFITDLDKGEFACIFSRSYHLDNCIVSHSEARQEVNRQLFDIIQMHPDDDFITALRKHFDDYL